MHSRVVLYLVALVAGFSVSVAATCKAGWYLDGHKKECLECPAGEWSKAKATSCSKSKCPKGTASLKPGATTPNACSTCPSGTFGPGGSSGCSHCEGGWYSEGGWGSCKECPAGSHSKGKSPKCEVCPAGYYSANKSHKCLPCSPGTFSTKGSATCSLCPAGKSSTKADSKCEPCKPGTYNNKPGSTCHPCPLGTFTPFFGAKSCCKCCAGFYTTATVGSKSCKQCPKWDPWTPVGTAGNHCKKVIPKGHSVAKTCTASANKCPVAPVGPTPPPHKPKRSLQCTKGFESCPHWSGRGGTECVDTQSNPEMCGGCVALDGTGDGRDCTAIPHVSIVHCQNKTCLIESCRNGYEKSEDGQSCLPSRQLLMLQGTRQMSKRSSL